MKRVTLLFVLTLCLTHRSLAIEMVHWERLPLAVGLVVGQERVIFLDRPVRVGVPSSLSGHLRVQSAAGAAYLRASAPFATSRIQFQDVDTGALILLDVSAVDASADQPPLEPIRIVDSEALSFRDRRSHAAAALSPAAPAGAGAAPATPIPVILTRYAAQALYAPLRTVESGNSVVPVPLPHELSLDTLLPALAVQMKALAAWRLGEDWVTAIRITNASDRSVELDPRALQGDFLAATFQHSFIGPRGDPTDTTVLYLVTHRHGLGDALLPAVSAVDASVNQAGPSHATNGTGHEE